MKVESLIIKNFKAIKDEQIEINGKNVYVMSKNGKGKSSFIDSVFKLLTNKNLPPEPLNKDADLGMIEINMGDYIAGCKITDQKMDLYVQTAEGVKVNKAPRTFLDEKVGVIDFDINKFLKDPASKQIEQIKKFAGIDFTKLDQEYKEVFAKRTDSNSRKKDLTAKLKPYDKTKVQKIDLTKLNEDLTKAREQNKDYNDVKIRKQDREKRIVEIDKLIKELTDEKNDLSNKINLAQTWLSENDEIPIDLMEQEFENAIKHNEEVLENQKMFEIDQELNAEIITNDLLNKRLDEIAAEKERIIKASKMPVPGLSFNDEGLLYNGLPLDTNQINTAELIIIGLQLNLALIKDVRIARFDASLLDYENIQRVEDWAKENDLQLFVEIVDRDADSLRIEVKEHFKS